MIKNNRQYSINITKYRFRLSKETSSSYVWLNPFLRDETVFYFTNNFQKPFRIEELRVLITSRFGHPSKTRHRSYVFLYEG